MASSRFEHQSLWLRYWCDKERIMTTDNFLKAELALFVWQNAHEYGGIDNMLALAFVLRNRVKQGWNGGDWSQVIAEAPSKAGDATIKGGYPDVRDTVVRMLLSRIDGVFNDSERDVYTVDHEGRGALYYTDLANTTNPWFKANILQKLENHPIVAKVGPVSFFR